MKSLFGSAALAAAILVSLFLLAARSSVAETLISSFQKPNPEQSQGSRKDSITDPLRSDVASAESSNVADATRTTAEEPGAGEKTRAVPTAATRTVTTPAAATVGPNLAAVVPTGSEPKATAVTVGAPYTATAYCLGGRTANGMRVAKGLIAADPRVLPLGTRVRLEAGTYTGEYLVADTGGAVRGKRIDIWIPTSHEAFRFGRRLVKLTVLSYPARRAFAPRHRKA